MITFNKIYLGGYNLTEILKFIFETLTGECTLFENILADKIYLAIVGSIAFYVAWKVVGNLYDDGLIYGSTIGKIIHWSVRTIAFLGVFYIGFFIVKVYEFIILYKFQCLIGVIMSIILYLLIRRRYGMIQRT